jgi:hypothetical protein
MLDIVVRTRDVTHELQGQEDAPSEAESDAQKPNPMALSPGENSICDTPETKHAQDCRPHQLRNPYLSVIVWARHLLLLFLDIPPISFPPTTSATAASKAHHIKASAAEHAALYVEDNNSCSMMVVRNAARYKIPDESAKTDRAAGPSKRKLLHAARGSNTRVERCTIRPSPDHSSENALLSQQKCRRRWTSRSRGEMH